MSKTATKRRTRKRVLHNSVLLLLTTGLTATVYAAGEQRTTLANLSLATAYASVLLLVIALCVGSIRLFQGKSLSGSNDLRRDAGIGSGALAIIHTLLGLQVHFAGRMQLYFVFPKDRESLLPFRYDAFGVANYSGLLGCALFCFLLYLSNDRSLRRLGPRKWKVRQRFAYLAALLVLAHGLIYQALEERNVYFVLLLLGMFAVGSALQSGGFIIWRRKFNVRQLSGPRRAGLQNPVHPPECHREPPGK